MFEIGQPVYAYWKSRYPDGFITRLPFKLHPEDTNIYVEICTREGERFRLLKDDVHIWNNGDSYEQI